MAGSVGQGIARGLTRLRSGSRSLPAGYSSGPASARLRTCATALLRSSVTLVTYWANPLSAPTREGLYKPDRVYATSQCPLPITPTGQRQRRCYHVFRVRASDVYQAALQFIALVDQVVHQLPQGYSHRKNQLLRSADSIADNLAEGVGEYAVNERRRFLRISRRSALEAASQLLVIQRHRQAKANLLEQSLALLHRIVCMLTKMISATKDRRIA